MGNIYIIL